MLAANGVSFYSFFYSFFSTDCILVGVWLLHTLRRSCTILIVQLRRVFKGDNLYAFDRLSVLPFRKPEYWDFFKHHKRKKRQILHDSATH